ncbi:MAG: peptide chain release factor 2 [Deltaproteobacteria bacterium]|nr:peptide chain release factor 2 [Deltaproteobacteria bacterium]
MEKNIEILDDKLAKIRGAFDPDKINQRIEEINKIAAGEDFFSNKSLSTSILKEKTYLDNRLNPFIAVYEEFKNLKELAGLAIQENDSGLLAEIEQNLKTLEKTILTLEIELTLSGKDDKLNAIVEIHAGSGGTESMDFASMLLRMYLRWADKKKFSVNIMEFNAGDEAGVKSVTFIVSGVYAYGYLKSETGVHRLVRISPFDSNKRRHTSFASVFVYPEIEDTSEIIIDEKDLRIDTYRSSGAGGQHVNTTDSAVRITHLPTGVAVACQNERSQHKNKDTALKLLKVRLYDYYRKKKEEEENKLQKDKKEISWGSQIRSYTLNPNRVIKDHRTGVTIYDTESVFDGNIDEFINGYLIGQISS